MISKKNQETIKVLVIGLGVVALTILATTPLCVWRHAHLGTHHLCGGRPQWQRVDLHL